MNAACTWSARVKVNQHSLEASRSATNSMRTISGLFLPRNLVVPSDRDRIQGAISPEPTGRDLSPAVWRTSFGPQEANERDEMDVFRLAERHVRSDRKIRRETRKERALQCRAREPNLSETFRWRRRSISRRCKSERDQNRDPDGSTARSVAGFGGEAPLRALTRITGRTRRPRDPAMFADEAASRWE